MTSVGDVTIKCSWCGLEVVGHMDDRGVVRASRTPNPRGEVVNGMCMTCLDKLRAGEDAPVEKEPAPVVTGAPVPGATTTT